MPQSPEQIAEYAKKRADFEFRIRNDLEFCRMSKENQAQEVGVSRPTVVNWHKEVDWNDVAKHVNENVKREMSRLDASLLEKALRPKADAKTMELAYQRLDGWSAKQTIEHLKKPEQIDDKEKYVADILVKWTPERRERCLNLMNEALKALGKTIQLEVPGEAQVTLPPQSQGQNEQNVANA